MALDEQDSLIQALIDKHLTTTHEALHTPTELDDRVRAVLRSVIVEAMWIGAWGVPLDAEGAPQLPLFDDPAAAERHLAEHCNQLALTFA